MIIGNFVFGRYTPDRECTLLESRKIAKIKVYIDKYQLSPLAESRFIALCASLPVEDGELLFKAYINNYSLSDSHVCCFLDKVQHSAFIKHWIASRPLGKLSDDTMLFVLKHFYEMYLSSNKDKAEEFFSDVFNYVRKYRHDV